MDRRSSSAERLADLVARVQLGDAAERLLALMGGCAAVCHMSILHLAGRLDGSKPFEPTRPGIAEALIGAVLLTGAIVLLRRWRHAWAVAVAANAFAVAGFAIGLTRTVQGGGGVDLGYHATVLPLLVLTLIVLVRQGVAGTDQATP
jgi:peptidoglycan/LPS O-acetylase OafA/YrhL